MIRDREAVRLIADLLERVERGGGGIEEERMEALADVDLLLLLGQRDHREVVEAEVLEHLEPDVELAAPPSIRTRSGSGVPCSSALANRRVRTSASDAKSSAPAAVRMRKRL